MDARFDTPFESWGGFSQTKAGDPMIHGRLRYHPEKGVELELVENPQGVASLAQGGATPLETMYGQLVDGTRVTLSKCFISHSSIQIGVGIGSPTTLTVNQATFGRHVDDLDHLLLKKYSTTFSSLSNWTCAVPVKCDVATVNEKPAGFDVTCRLPAPIDVVLPNRAFDLQIAHGMKTRNPAGTFAIEWEAGITVSAHESLPFEAMREIAWQCQNLLSLLIGHRLSTREITITPADAIPAAVPERPLQLLYHQIGRHDHPDAHPALMLLPYGLVKDEFSQMVDKWFARSEQAVLATNVFFGSQSHQSPAVNVKFLSAAQAAESYHRSLGSGLYMEQPAFDAAIQEFVSHMPAAIQGDHRHSLKNRLKYGNEHSLRKRLAELFARIPANAQGQIGTDVGKFIAKVVDTRNYYTHYDHASQANAFEAKSAFIAAERLRILVVANLLHDLGIKDENLLGVLQRSQDFQHWMSQALPL